MVKEGSAGNPQKKKAKKQGNADQTVGDQHGQPTTDQAIQLNGEAGPSTSPKKKKKKAKDAQGPVVEGTTPGNGQADDAGYTVDQNAGDDDVADNQGLSELQQKMKKRLKGAQFRFINETLYTSESTTALNMIKEDPKMFEEAESKQYHKGFRSQCKSWPVNPVSHYITALSSYPKTKIIADLGCGDGALARTLSPQGFSVLSYDLLSDGVYITEADICTKLPLPGKDVDNSAERIGQVVDICVCSLSLMSVNWVGCIREARRVLKDGGELKIAEVTSRFVDVDAFIALIARIGFKLVYKGAGNTHFMLFEFRKISRNPISEEEWTSLMEKGSMLKPCEYKRR
ncbi:hypothetical protein SISSUDRAFT_992989 [Sistotremastrum suecicum HHB10207 ss-3]|uniref:Ribosomal RNA-processing protein 8 n=1 Tax=Sistotremastrum suecicum HHB10207 ss-3 TaxID=1314776 RepID=A0A165YPJ8_9AGAM|nr:hypothetical protein SISSUDRAFT_992989 [Sistotremastrum suecicum HHB10207 ss-3]